MSVPRSNIAGLLLAMLMLIASIGLAEPAGATSTQALSWGNNHLGQLGDGTKIAHATPQPIGGGHQFTKLDAGHSTSLALAADRTVWFWGDTNPGHYDVPFGATPILTPAQVTGLTNIVDIAAGRDHNLAVGQDGKVWAWGANEAGQLGDGSTTHRTTPVRVSGLTEVVGIAGGRDFSLAVRANGEVWAWGNNGNGQLGDGTHSTRSTPVRVAALSGAAGVSAGEGHSIALRSDGTVWAWGLNSAGQLGDGTRTARTTPVRVTGLTAVTAVSAGDDHNLALRSGGEVWAFGGNQSGQLGDGTQADRPAPVRVSGLPAVTQISAASRLGAAITGGTLYVWGANGAAGSGRFGDGTTAAATRTVPAAVPGLTGVQHVGTGGNHVLAVRTLPGS